MSNTTPLPQTPVSAAGCLTFIVVFLLSYLVIFRGYGLLAVVQKRTGIAFQEAAEKRGLLDETTQSLRLTTWRLSVVTAMYEGSCALIVIAGVFLIVSAKGSAGGN